MNFVVNGVCLLLLALSPGLVGEESKSETQEGMTVYTPWQCCAFCGTGNESFIFTHGRCMPNENRTNHNIRRVFDRENTPMVRFYTQCCHWCGPYAGSYHRQDEKSPCKALQYHYLERLMGDETSETNLRLTKETNKANSSDFACIDCQATVAFIDYMKKFPREIIEEWMAVFCNGQTFFRLKCMSAVLWKIDEIVYALSTKMSVDAICTNFFKVCLDSQIFVAASLRINATTLIEPTAEATKKERQETVATTSQCSRSGGCPDGWITYKESCYFVGHDKKNYEDAKAECKRIGGSHLWNVDTQDEWNSINRYSPLATNVWLGNSSLFKKEGGDFGKPDDMHCLVYLHQPNFEQSKVLETQCRRLRLWICEQNSTFAQN